MRIELQVEVDEHVALSALAKADSLPLAAWCRFQLMQLARGRKAADAAPEPAKPTQARGPRRQTMDEYLDAWATPKDEEEPRRFENGQRRYGFIDRRYKRQPDAIDDPGLHAAFEQDLRANCPKQEIVEDPAAGDYWRAHYWVRPTDPLPRPSRDVASVDDNGRLRSTTLPEE